MGNPRPSRYDSPEYRQARAQAEALDDKELAATVEILRTALAAYGDVLAGRRRKTDPEKLAAAYAMLASRRS